MMYFAEALLRHELLHGLAHILLLKAAGKEKGGQISQNGRWRSSLDVARTRIDFGDSLASRSEHQLFKTFLVIKHIFVSREKAVIPPIFKKLNFNSLANQCKKHC